MIFDLFGLVLISVILCFLHHPINSDCEISLLVSGCNGSAILHDLFHRPPIPLRLATRLHHLGNLSSQHKFIDHLVDNFLFAYSCKSPVFSPGPLFNPSARCVWRSLTSCHQPCPGNADSHFSAHLRCAACASCVHRESSVHHCLLLKAALLSVALSLFLQCHLVVVIQHH